MKLSGNILNVKRIACFISGCIIIVAGMMHYALCWQIAMYVNAVANDGPVDHIFYVSPLAHISFAVTICVAILLWRKAKKES